MTMWRTVIGTGGRQRFGLFWSAWVVSWLLHGLYTTLRPVYIQQHFEHEVRQAGPPFLVAFWHGRLLYILRLYQRQRATVLVSRSQDGEFISHILQHFGIQPTRGSTSRGSIQGLYAMVKKVRRGYIAGFTPDGPRGPCYHVQAGIVAVAQKTGATILPLTYNAQWKKVLPTWDRFVLPLPFSRVVVVYGEPITVPAQASMDTLQAKRREVEMRLRQITDVADRYFQSEQGGDAR
jgi:lysophospholipid acyltransferase (LPLAT)-like uncharacterized protein